MEKQLLTNKRKCRILKKYRKVKLLDEIAANLRVITSTVTKPKSAAEKVLEIIIIGVTIAGIITIIDTIRNWIIGG